MTNKQGLKIIEEGIKIFERDAKNALKDKDYNLVIRRCQESIEIILKGFLKFIGVDYPKVHHVGDVFREKIKEKRIKIDDKILDKIENTSFWLSKARESAFYFEKFYKKQDANRALKDIEFVVYEIKKVLSFYKK